MSSELMTPLVWLGYGLAAAMVWWFSYRLFLQGRGVIGRVLTIVLAVMLFSPAFMPHHDGIAVVPMLFAFFFQALAKSETGMLQAIIPALFLIGAALIIDSFRRQPNQD